ncbi:hypothetical protein ACIGXQ_35530 [Streptomyces anulatus]
MLISTLTGRSAGVPGAELSSASACSAAIASAQNKPVTGDGTAP